MNAVYIDSFNIISSLGHTADSNFSKIKAGESGIKKHLLQNIDDEIIHASLIDELEMEKLSNSIKNQHNYSRFEKLLIASIADAGTKSSIDFSTSETIFIISTTKGNISLLETEAVSDELIHRMSLSTSAKKVAHYFNNPNEPIVISNACISGVVAIMHGSQLLQDGNYKNAVVAGADVISKFVYSGFKSFQALSAGGCSPFSNNRDGINLGEAAATILLTTSKVGEVSVLEGSISNDSNHISGPSRSGAELSHAINSAIHKSGINKSQLGFISAHGTATLYNDEMEAKAFDISELNHVPVNSLKGYFGHTLGAAGILESIISIQSLQNDIIIPTKGFTERGVSVEVNIINQLIHQSNTHCLKTASGFGGCNAALIFSKS